MDKLEPMLFIRIEEFSCFGKQLDVPQKCQNGAKTYAQIYVHKCS